MLKKSFHILAVLALLFFMVPQTSLAVTLDWEAMVNSTQTGVRSPGFGDENNLLTYNMVTFGDYMYVSNYNETTGTEIWRTNNGTDWAQVNDDGFGTAGESYASLVVFNNQLYAFNSVITDTDTKVYRTDNGTTWANVATIANMTSPGSTAVYNGALYVSLFSGGGTSAVYKSTNGTAWTSSNSNGFGDADNAIIQSMTVFDNDLYAGTYNDVDGSEVWHFDGATWDQDNSDGFGGADNTSTGTLTIFGNYLYATVNNVAGVEVWRTPGDQTWAKVGDAGFGQATDAITTFGGIVFENNLYIGATSAKVFRTSDGATWQQVNEDGFGFDDNNVVTFGILGDYIYAGAGTLPTVPDPVPNTTEIYRFGTPEPVPEVEVLPQTGADL